MIKVKLTEPKEPTVNISLDVSTAQELVDALREHSESYTVGDNLKNFVDELWEVLS